MQFDKERLSKIPINQVVEAFGGNYKNDREPGSKQYNMHCCNGTFHKEDDKNPSLTVWTNANICKCHACGLKGGTINVTMHMLNCDFKEACEWLHNRFDIPFLDGYKSLKPAKKLTKPRPKQFKYMFFNQKRAFKHIDISDWIGKFKDLTDAQKLKIVYTYIYRFSLTTNTDAMLNYYKGRGISNNVHLNKIGFLSIDDISTLVESLFDIFPVDDLIMLGIVNDAKHKYPLSWKQLKNVLLVPSFDLYSDLIEGFMLRAIEKSTNRWFTGKESRLSIPSIIKPLPFGIGSKLLRRDCDIYTSEGHIDAFSLPEEYCFIAPPGVDAFEKKQLGLLKGRNIKIVFDQDDAGQQKAWGYYDIKIGETRKRFLKSQKDDMEAELRLLKSQNKKYTITKYDGLKDELLRAGAKSVEIITWDKNLGKDINDLLKNGNLSKVFR